MYTPSVPAAPFAASNAVGRSAQPFAPYQPTYEQVAHPVRRPIAPPVQQRPMPTLPRLQAPPVPRPAAPLGALDVTHMMQRTAA